MRTNTTTRLIVPTSRWLGPVFSSNTAATSFASIAPTVTKPTTNSTTGVGIVDVTNAVSKFAFFGTDAANETFDVKIIAWSKVWEDISGTASPGKSADKNVEWIPTTLAFLTITLGSATGASGGVVGGTSQLFADTIAQASGGYASSAINIISPGDNLPGQVEISHSGAQLIGLYFDMTGAASANAVYMGT